MEIVKSLRVSPTNKEKLGKLHDSLEALLNEVLRQGVHGSASLELLIVDGTIHRISRRVEHIDR